MDFKQSGRNISDSAIILCNRHNQSTRDISFRAASDAQSCLLPHRSEILMCGAVRRSKARFSASNKCLFHIRFSDKNILRPRLSSPERPLDITVPGHTITGKETPMFVKSFLDFEPSMCGILDVKQDAAESS